jgi:hypothetical protein
MTSQPLLDMAKAQGAILRPEGSAQVVASYGDGMAEYAALTEGAGLIDNSLVLGAILVLVVLLLPSGLLPALTRWRARRDVARVSRRQASSTRRRRSQRGSES